MDNITMSKDELGPIIIAALCWYEEYHDNQARKGLTPTNEHDDLVELAGCHFTEEELEGYYVDGAR